MRTQWVVDQRHVQACTGERRCDEAEGGLVARLPVPGMEVHQRGAGRAAVGGEEVKSLAGRFAVADVERAVRRGGTGGRGEGGGRRGDGVGWPAWPRCWRRAATPSM